MFHSEPSINISNFTECLKYLQSLEDCYMVPDKFKSQFKKLLQNLNECFTALLLHGKMVPSTKCKSKVLLCLSQISKSLNLFTGILQTPLYRQGVWYVCERLRWCVSELRRICFSPESFDNNDTDSGSFLLQVDLVLQLLETKGSIVVRDASWNQLINDVICQAVTIAKMAATLDYNEITSACQGILEVNSHLMNEDPTNTNKLSLITESMFNRLISLEERVNVAILRLFLQVFSEPSKPVKELVRKCGRAPSSRSLTDVDTLVAQLDTHFERVVLIGQFAASCCDNAARVRGIQCCLASVESIDNYLVPALKALYLSPGCEDKCRFAKLLCDHWQDEADTLHSHLNNIVDSFAFTRVVQESVQDLSEGVSRDQATDQVFTIIKQAWLLYKHLTPSGLDLALFKQSIGECEAALNQKVAACAIIKRLRLVVAAVDKLAEELKITHQSQQPLIADKTGMDTLPIEKSLQDLTLDVSFSSTKSQYASYRPPWLQKKICEMKKNKMGKCRNQDDLAVKNENVYTPKYKPGVSAYETPSNRVKTDGDLLTPFLNKTCERNTTMYVRTPRRLVQNLLMDESAAPDCSWSTVNESQSLALEISDILDNLTALADTLSGTEAEVTSWQQQQPSPSADIMKRYFSGGSFDSQWFTSVKTEEGSADVDTLERIEDLKLVDEKIRNLKLL